MRVGIKAVEKQVDAMPPANLVFLVDVSGSMEAPNKLPLVKSSLKLLVDQLREQDRVSLIVYAGRTAVELPSTAGNEKANEIGEVRLRYKKLESDSSVEMRSVVEGNGNQLLASKTLASHDLNFVAAVAAYGQLLRNSNYLGTWTYEDTANQAQKAVGNDTQGYRREFVKMVKLTSTLNKSK